MNTLERWIAPSDITLLHTAGEDFISRASDIILHGERGEFRSEADADMFIMQHTGELIETARRFHGRIVADHAATASRGVAVLTSIKHPGRYIVRTYTFYTNDGRTWDTPTYANTEAEARADANEVWAALRG